MGFIRPRAAEKTGYQNGCGPIPQVDFGCDFVMVYRNDPSFRERLAAYRGLGYVTHFMTGISWGHYLDYLNGDFDGETHWDEAQTDRFGNMILHSPNVPYMVPTISFADYIAAKLRDVVDAGVEAVHVEEPEFWDRAGYSGAFKREYLAYYGSPWQAPHTSADAAYKCAKLKQYLYTRTIDRVSAAVKAYSLRKYSRAVRFYVPTHSLLNYTQWKIVSPEGRLADIPCVDGCVAQVWTGTAREKNWYAGRLAERTFETAYLEYGVMQELVKGTGRRMWFLHDPIEDNPVFDWTDYRKNYLCTVAASLLHTGVNDYEICPWPDRVFTGKYPRGAENAEPIPPEYATLLNTLFQTLGDVPTAEPRGLRVGVLMADSQLYQRAYPDCEFSEPPKEEVGTVLVESEELAESFRRELINGAGTDRETKLRFMQSSAFPAFYALALPLVKAGVETRPVLLDNARRYPGYLDDYGVLVMSYEFLKPEYPDIDLALAEWVRRGGVLIYVGDGADPFHQVRSWWTGKYPTAAEHLFEMLSLPPAPEKGVYPFGSGYAAVWRTDPCRFCYSEENAAAFRAFFREAAAAKGFSPEEKNYLTARRGPYVIASVMDESVGDAPLTLRGSFVDLFDPALPAVSERTVRPGENALLYDLDAAPGPVAVVGTSVRILSMQTDETCVSLTVRGAAGFTARVRVKLPFAPASAEIDGAPCACVYHAESGTALLTFESVAGDRRITLYR